MKIITKTKAVVISRYFIINTITGLVFFYYLYYSEVGSFPKLVEEFFKFLVMVSANFIGVSLNKFNRLINKFFAWKKNISIRFLLGIILNYAANLLLIFGLLTLYFLAFHENYFIADFFEEFNEIVLRIYILSFFTIFIYVISDFAFYSYNQYSVVQIENIKLVTQQIELQFEALKTQLSPHYLFNSLNTTSSLLFQDPELTEKFIRKLAKTYQYILESDNEKLILLSEELKFIEAYKFLLDVRFGEGILIDFNIDDLAKECYIPPLSLQILIENAVKHNAFDKDAKLNIMVSSENDYLIVENNKLRKPQSNSSFKIGMQNIRKRYGFFTNRKIKVTDNESFKVSIPLLNEKKVNQLVALENSSNQIFNN